MKYLFFFVGLFLLVASTGVAIRGAEESWDAGAAIAPTVIGTLLIAFSVGIHIYDNWTEKTTRR